MTAELVPLKYLHDSNMTSDGGNVEDRISTAIDRVWLCLSGQKNLKAPITADQGLVFQFR